MSPTLDGMPLMLNGRTLTRNGITPMPYQPGKSLELHVLCSNLPVGQTITATISKTFDITMSPVMNVTIDTEESLNFRAILKLYDRRFGKRLRELLGVHVAQTEANEAVFQSFARRGEVDSFLLELEEEKKAAIRDEISLPLAEDFLDGTLKGSAKYEAALWQECDDFFHCETEAYERLRGLQGKSIPHIYAHVCLKSDVPPDMHKSPMARYFEVKGILLEFIPGYTLWDLPNSPLDSEMWQAIVQSTVDAVHDINMLGVIMDDCSPRNVVVNKHSLTPFIIDLAQCWFKDKLIEAWSTMESGEDWNPEADYWKTVKVRNNPGAIGATMKRRMLKSWGIHLKVEYPVQAPYSG